MNATLETTAMRGRPLMPVRGVVSVIDRDEFKVVELIEEGILLYAWNLALQPELARSKMLMILPACVDAFQAKNECELDPSEALRLVLPHDEPTIQVVELERSLNVTETHLYALIRRNELVSTTMPRRGPGGSARVTASSVRRFMRRRRYPFSDPEF